MLLRVLIQQGKPITIPHLARWQLILPETRCLLHHHPLTGQLKFGWNLFIRHEMVWADSLAYLASDDSSILTNRQKNPPQ
jgi:hypothetical protein